jgi:hypothetical protein
MSVAANLERFPPRRFAVVWLLLDCGEWSVLARGHGWVHGSYGSAIADAQWLSKNLGLPIRVVAA